MTVQFMDPEPSRGGSQTRVKWRPLLEEVKLNPGVWAQLSANTWRTNLGIIKSWGNKVADGEGDFEVVSRKADGEDHPMRGAIFARYTPKGDA